MPRHKTVGLECADYQAFIIAAAIVLITAGSDAAGTAKEGL
jgi:hypothetical protein